MEALLLEIISAIKEAGGLSDKRLAAIVRTHNGPGRKLAKKHILPYYLRVKRQEPKRWALMQVDAATEALLFKALRQKPRRTASGVATVTVITKPWPCASDCLYCPSDLRMPKSYLSDEPACQRAERNYFDPYLQVASRLRALAQMGHVTDKVELIVLGGTWSDYPQEYQVWFVKELFRALNDSSIPERVERNSRKRRRLYRRNGISSAREELAARAAGLQAEVDSLELSYNQAIKILYADNPAWQRVSAVQRSSTEELLSEQQANEGAAHRVVGLSMETRPDAVSCESLLLLRRLGCTKIQMGIQSLSTGLLELNNRGASLEAIRQAFVLLRLFGFKIHTHFMLNLLGASPKSDAEEYRRFVTDAAFLPDEVKLYPCSLVTGTRLCGHYASGEWRPYGEEELVGLLAGDLAATPAFIRVSRMIRDISAHDIVAGNRKANLRQMVEKRLEDTAAEQGEQASKYIREIRYREIGTGEVRVQELSLTAIRYATSASDEHFLQWQTPEGRIAGFLRLSLPKPECVSAFGAVLPIAPHEAMIREVHVYGKVAGLEGGGEGSGDGGAAAGAGAGGHAQHHGLGRRLIAAACDIARASGYTKLNVISSVGTRQYYRSLGFKDNGLYQQLRLE